MATISVMAALPSMALPIQMKRFISSARAVRRIRTTSLAATSNELSSSSDGDGPYAAYAAGAERNIKMMSEDEKRHRCYLLRSIDPNYPLKTYIGYTTDPQRRVRQHNGEIVGGARRTKAGRPWECVAVVEGFADNVAAMQFEWAWQHTGRSKVFRHAVGSDTLARKMKRRRGVEARLDELHVLLERCPPFNVTSLRVDFQGDVHRDLYCSLSGRGVSSPTRRLAFQSRLGGTSASVPFLFRRFGTTRARSGWALCAASTDIVDTGEEKKEVKVPAKFRPYPFSYHQELTVTIESLTNLGFGIARVDLDEDGALDYDENPGKWVVFVPNVIPGEIVKARIYRNYASYSDADLIEVLKPSGDRVEPKCSLSSVCGGCQYQHININRQRKMKRDQVQELFERNGELDKESFPEVLDTLGTDDIWNYRSKITPHYEAPLKKRRRNQEVFNNVTCQIREIGFKEKASRRLVDVPYCHIATEAINDHLTQVREDIRQDALEGRLRRPSKGATLLLRDSDGKVETDNNVYVNTTVKDLVFKFKAGK